MTNVRTGGAATQTTAGTYAVTADFVPTDTTNYTTLIGLAAGNFVITKATPTATLTVSNSPQCIRCGPGGDRHAHELGAGDGDEHSDRRDRDQDDGGDVCGDGGLRPDRRGELHHARSGLAAGTSDRQGDADGDADGDAIRRRAY